MFTLNIFKSSASCLRQVYASSTFRSGTKLDDASEGALNGSVDPFSFAPNEELKSSGCVVFGMVA